MSDLGQQLKEARLARGLSLDDVQEMTKIRKRYLEAIEAGDYKVLPGSFYVRAFIKTYAEVVGVDPDELLNEHKQHVPDVAPEPTMEPVLQKRRSSRTAERNSKWLSTTLMWSFAVLILVVIYMYFTVWGKSHEAKDNEPDQTPVTDVSKGNNGTTGNGDPNGPDAGIGNEGTAGNTGTSNNGTGDNGTDGTGTGNDETDTNGSGNTDTGTDAGTGTVVVAPDGKEGSTTKFLVQSAGDQPVQVVINATGTSWVEVRKGDKSGDKLYFNNTTDGEVLTYELGPEGLFIKSGASSKTAITVGGQVVTDGKNTSKIQLNLGSVDAGSANGSDGLDNGTTDGTDNQGTANNVE